MNTKLVRPLANKDLLGKSTSKNSIFSFILSTTFTTTKFELLHIVTNLDEPAAVHLETYDLDL